MVYGTYAGVDFIASPYHIYHGQPYARVDLSTMSESTLSRCQGLRIWPQISSTMEGTGTLPYLGAAGSVVDPE